jgi:uncharacterized protein (DUF1697 family)
MTARASTIHVALLRGINVSGKNKLPMAELAQMFEDAGCQEVETYIQSGNVVFAAAARLARRVPTTIREAISESFGYDVPVIIRSTGELESIARDNPFVIERAEPKALHVAFLAKEPASTQIADLDAHRSPPDRFAVLGREIYLCCPQGIGRSKLTTAYFDAKLKTTTTIRNWRTVTRLLEMVVARERSP